MNTKSSLNLKKHNLTDLQHLGIKPKSYFKTLLDDKNLEYKFVLGNLHINDLKNVVAFLWEENILDNEEVPFANYRTIEDICVIIYDKDKKIVAISYCIPDTHDGMQFYQFCMYVSRKNRSIGLGSSKLHKIITSLTYHDSYEYSRKNNLNHIQGISMIMFNKKFFDHYNKTFKSGSDLDKKESFKKIHICDHIMSVYGGKTSNGLPIYLMYYPDLFTFVL